jgi:hypothetical protein
MAHLEFTLPQHVVLAYGCVGKLETAAFARG